MPDFIRDTLALVTIGAFIGMVAVWTASFAGIA